ncbi:MAG TPA: RHS repeat-associated core domain-containing protein, partial [Acidobacteriota bacterium]|nr:RHS repeat-associated core domain-containing protein [Acidobacteriota bacterium]HNT18595.1 RHS repeat-associated core domain-containing protein [Acidobacteriota bacterium]
GADQTIATPFDGTVLTYCIFGQVTDDKGTGVEGVSVNLDPVDPTPHMSTLTDSSGNYQFCDLANGRYWVTCKGGGHYFWTIVVNNADRYGIDFQLESPTESREESSGQGLIERKNAKAVKSKAGDNRLQSNTETSAFSPQPSALASGTPESTGAVRYYIWDHLGTTRVVTDGNGALISTHDYEPFGVEIPPFGDTGNVTDLPSPNSHKFTGHERDQSTGYDYMHFRYYGSNIGRFMKPDKIGGQAGDPQSWNKYVYCNGNPVKYFDPDGLFGHIAHQDIAMYALDRFAAKYESTIKSNSVQPDVGLGKLRLGQHFDMNPDPNIDSRDVLADQKIAQARQIELQGGDMIKAVGLYSQAGHFIADKWGHRVANGKDAQGNTIFRDVSPAEHVIRTVIGVIQKLFGHADTFNPDSEDEPSFKERKEKAKEETKAKSAPPTEATATSPAVGPKETEGE